MVPQFLSHAFSRHVSINHICIRPYCYSLIIAYFFNSFNNLSCLTGTACCLKSLKMVQNCILRHTCFTCLLYMFFLVVLLSHHIVIYVPVWPKNGFNFLLRLTFMNITELFYLFMTLLYYFAFLLVELLFFWFADLFFEAAGCNKRGERMEWSKLSGLETNSGGRIHPLYTEHVISRCYWNFLTFGDQ